MKLMKTSLLATLFLTAVLLSGCTGAEGPMGPAGVDGVDGAGTQTTYIFDITPTLSLDSEVLSCPAIQASAATNDFSTVTVYMRSQSSLGVWEEDLIALPYSDTENSGENYFFTVKAGTVEVGWSGLPELWDFEIVVTVVND